uniref:Putative secreted peptide n=1 Tax=Anopheles braziliensis TaxID=58242 RepID=A0A2M3ZVQ3_9DIPT
MVVALVHIRYIALFWRVHKSNSQRLAEAPLWNGTLEYSRSRISTSRATQIHFNLHGGEESRGNSCQPEDPLLFFALLFFFCTRRKCKKDK